MISIITPAYIDTIEKLEWLNEMIASVQSQTWQDWELVLMDDASPITLTLQNPDERVRQLRMVNRSGPALSRNTAAAVASYDCLFPLDADDILAGNEVLRTMYIAWDRDRSKVIYGDLQQLEQVDGRWDKGRFFNLPDYTFEKCKDLNGIMPVTCMHSVECHVKAGGWKPELEAGLEDIEYWIAAGKAGFCGQKLNDLTALFYRKSTGSRHYTMKFVTKRETEMRNYIRELHSDVYEGRYPMACCDGSKSYTPPPDFQASSVSQPTSLDQFSNDMKVWVEYTGQREGSFGLVGQFTNIPYTINGVGHKLEVHVNDLPKFKHSGRGLDFKIGVSAPNGVAKAPPQVKSDSYEFVAPEPQLAQILMLDR